MSNQFDYKINVRLNDNNIAAVVDGINRSFDGVTASVYRSTQSFGGFDGIVQRLKKNLDFTQFTQVLTNVNQGLQSLNEVVLGDVLGAQRIAGHEDALRDLALKRVVVWRGYVCHVSLLVIWTTRGARRSHDPLVKRRVHVPLTRSRLASPWVPAPVPVWSVTTPWYRIRVLSPI